VLLNIINAIKTGDVKAPEAGAMLSKAILSNKEREQTGSSGHDGCADQLQNRRAFDSDIAALMNDHNPSRWRWLILITSNR
jgi:hypothetical protein